MHSHISNVTLYNNTNVRGSSVNGTNIGLYSSAAKLDTFYVFNGNNEDLKLYISVHGYFQDGKIFLFIQMLKKPVCKRRHASVVKSLSSELRLRDLWV